MFDSPVGTSGIVWCACRLLVIYIYIGRESSPHREIVFFSHIFMWFEVKIYYEHYDFIETYEIFYDYFYFFSTMRSYVLRTINIHCHVRFYMYLYIYIYTKSRIQSRNAGPLSPKPWSQLPTNHYCTAGTAKCQLCSKVDSNSYDLIDEFGTIDVDIFALVSAH